MSLFKWALSAALFCCFSSISYAQLVSVDDESAVCQKKINSFSQRYLKNRARRITTCLDKVIACDNDSFCLAKLVRPAKGLCAAGKLDSGTTIGFFDTLAITGQPTRPTALLNRELWKLAFFAQRDCFDRRNADTTNGSGLGFNGAASGSQLVANMNSQDDGISCQADEGVLAYYPLAFLLSSQITTQLHNTCAVASSPAVIGDACSSDIDCGANGECGKAAQVLFDIATNKCN